MIPRRFKQFIPFLLIGGGLVLLFQGARIFFESRFGQSAARRQFEHRAPLRPPGPFVTPQLGETVARLSIPRLATQLYVVEGIGAADLRRGPGHMPGTVMPGGRGNCVIAAHRDTHFRVLKDIHTGDDIVIETGNGEFLYRVTSTRIVSPNNTSPLLPTAGPVLSLITCYPFYYVGSAPKRFIVEAELAGALNASLPPQSLAAR